MPFPHLWDSTLLATWRSCHHKFQLSAIEQWSRLGTSIHLHAGGAFAAGLEATRLAYVNGASPAEAIFAGVDALTVAYGDADPQGTAKSLDRMLGALEYYFLNYPLQTDPCKIITLADKPAIEWSFALPLPILHPDSGDPLIFCGRTDAVVNYAGGTYPLDDKTTSQLGASWQSQWPLRGQFLGYVWALRQLGIPASGAIVRGVSILKTKYDTQQAIVSVPRWLSDEWYEDTLAEIREAVRLYQSSERFRKNFSEACNEYSGCQFKQVCTLSSPEEWLSTYFERREWNPLTREERKY